MAYFGVQFRHEKDRPLAFKALAFLTTHFGRPGGPGHHALAHHVDGQGFQTLVATAYWDEPRQFQQWLDDPSLQAWWNDPARCQDGVGHFREILCPRVSHFETLFSTPGHGEGIGVLAEADSGEVREHSYWGSARDRLPAAQTDPLQAHGTPRAPRPLPGCRVLVESHDHMALIRSGQDWTQTSGREREIYLAEVEPVLRQGMAFLSDAEGLAAGCYANRYLRHIDLAGRTLEKSFGMSFWRSLGHLERWAASHPTHLAIFGSFLKMVEALNFELKLRLFHEVAVVRQDEQRHEYLNCHPDTGLLRTAERA